MNLDNAQDAVAYAVDSLLDTRSGTFSIGLMLPSSDQVTVAGPQYFIGLLPDNVSFEIAEEVD